LHFFGQIRYPQGIYHAYLDKNQWTSPSLIFLIAREGEEMGNRIHAHGLAPIVRAGNQLVLTFTDGPNDPNRRLFAMNRTLDDIPPLELVPTPALAATPLPEPSPTPRQPTPLPTPTATPPVFDRAATQPQDRVPRPDLIIWVALVPNLLVFGGLVFIRLLNSLRHLEHHD
jgi:hypothetical protein